MSKSKYKRIALMGSKQYTVPADKWDEFLSHKTDEETLDRCKRIDAIIPDSAMVQEFNRHEVACIIADAIGDDCACNVNGNDEWLPMYCDFSETVCPNPVGVACWEQYLKHLDKKPKGVQE